jgi:pentatricopeptide repeat protein
MESLEAGMTPDVETWGQLIDICAKEGDSTRASIALEQMIACGVQPDLNIYTSLFRVRSPTGNVSAPAPSRSEATPACPPSPPSSAVALAAQASARRACWLTMGLWCGCGSQVFSKSGNLERALQLYRQLQASELQISGLIYGILINAYIKERDVGKALEVYNDMRTAGLAPSNRLFRSMLEIFVERGFSGDHLEATEAMSLQAMVRTRLLASLESSPGYSGVRWRGRVSRLSLSAWVRPHPLNSRSLCLSPCVAAPLFLCPHCNSLLCSFCEAFRFGSMRFDCEDGGGARGSPRPACTRFKIQSCVCLGSAFEAACQTQTPGVR